MSGDDGLDRKCLYRFSRKPECPVTLGITTPNVKTGIVVMVYLTPDFSGFGLHSVYVILVWGGVMCVVVGFMWPEKLLQHHDGDGDIKQAHSGHGQEKKRHLGMISLGAVCILIGLLLSNWNTGHGDRGVKFVKGRGGSYIPWWKWF